MKKEWFRQRISVVIIIMVALFVFGEMVGKTLYYDAPEIAYEKSCRGHVYEIVEGVETDYIVGSKKIVVFEKNEKGWRLPSNSVMTIKCIKNVGETVICVSQYNNTDEYYLTITGYKEELELSDNRNSKFYKVDIEPRLFKSGVRAYFTYVHAINEQYVITINGQEITLLE